MALLTSRHHKKEKRFGPGPSNGYTKGSGAKPKFWQRKQRTTGLRDPEVGAVPMTTGGLAAPTHDVRPSHDTAYTGSTVAAPHTGYDSAHHNKNLSGGYHTAPTGTYNTTPVGTIGDYNQSTTGHYHNPTHNTPATNY
jgi:hypothetical protein